MSAQEQVAKLEALLARVHGRRGDPRPAAPSAVVVAPAEPLDRTPPPAPVAAAARPPIVAAPPPTPVAEVAPSAAITSPPPSMDPVAARAAAPEPKTPAPASVQVAAKAASPSVAPDANVDVDVEVEEGMAEVDLDGLDDEEGGNASLSDSVADLDAVAAGASTDEDDDEPELPASSRRPIQIQAPLEEAFNDSASAAPPHPVPPESGRQIAVPPILDFEGDLSGVRSVAAADAAPHVELKADVTRPVVAASSPAVFHGEVPAFQPATFGELLDATLGLSS